MSKKSKNFVWENTVKFIDVEEEKQIEKNRKKFIEDFKIINFANDMSLNNYLRLGIWSDDYLNGIFDKNIYCDYKYNMSKYGDIGQKRYSDFCDHRKDFKSQLQNSIIRVVSPYALIDEEKEEIYKKNGYQKYNNLYNKSTTTFIKIIYLKKKMNV